MRIILLFIVVPFVELFLLLKLAELTSGLWTFGLVVVTGIVGATLAKRQGWSVVTRLQRELHEGQLPTTTLVDALMIFVAGALLVTPGILTDAFGFSLLVPACRRIYRRLLLQWFRDHVRTTTASFSARVQQSDGDAHARPTAMERDRVIDSYVISRHEEDLPRGDNSSRDDNSAG